MCPRKNNIPWPLAISATFIMVMALLFSPGYAKTKSSEMLPEHQEFYHYAQYFFTKDEKKIFRNLTTDEARGRFIRNFWDIRDPDPYTEENEFKTEIESRYEYVTKYLKETTIPGWETDRGRIYLLLGHPATIQEDPLYIGRVIQWYYDDLNIYVLFYDEKGYGIYKMDLTRVSLSLLDVLDKNKYFIVNQEGKIRWENLDFDLKYDNKTREVEIMVKTKNFNYEDVPGESGTMLAKIKVDLIVYPSGQVESFFKFSEVKSIKIRKDNLLEKNAAVSLHFPLELPSGKVKIDAVVTDLLGDAVQRKFFTINSKK